MDNVARMSPRDRADLFQEVAAQRGDMRAEIIEKDFWVCWTLKRLFTLENPPAGILFKGGTSLSKVYNAIARFSEDVDLSFHREDLGFGGDDDPAKETTVNRQRKKLKKLKKACRQMIEVRLLPRLLKVLEETLGARPSEKTWQLILDSDDPDGQTLLFHYPVGLARSQEDMPAYIRPMVRLETGARGDHWPKETKNMVPYAAETLPRLFKDSNCPVQVLAAERTFLEKLTILHGCYHQPESKPLKDRQSRHYYDVVQLYATEIGKKAIRDHDLMKKVAHHQIIYFERAWAKYDEAVPGTIRLVPPKFRMKEIEQDYRKMQEMMIGNAPTFDQILTALTDLENAVNKGD